MKKFVYLQPNERLEVHACNTPTHVHVICCAGCLRAVPVAHEPPVDYRCDDCRAGRKIDHSTSVDRMMGTELTTEYRNHEGPKPPSDPVMDEHDAALRYKRLATTLYEALGDVIDDPKLTTGFEYTDPEITRADIALDAARDMGVGR